MLIILVLGHSGIIVAQMRTRATMLRFDPRTGTAHTQAPQPSCGKHFESRCIPCSTTSTSDRHDINSKPTTRIRMCVYMYIYIYVYIGVRVSLPIYIYMYTCICICKGICRSPLDLVYLNPKPSLYQPCTCLYQRPFGFKKLKGMKFPNRTYLPKASIAIANKETLHAHCI